MEIEKEVYFRGIQPSDYEQLKLLHEVFFPVRYSENFYRDACNGIGLNGGQLLSVIAVNRATQEMVGFILAQFIPAQKAEDTQLFYGSGPLYVCYVLTLGLVERYRRSGMGSILLRNCINQAKMNPDCGAVYLHVITYNSAAIKFYERNQFELLRTLENFYLIKNVSYSAHLYILYINGYRCPLFFQFLKATRELYSQAVAFTLSWIDTVVPTIVQSFSSTGHTIQLGGSSDFNNISIRSNSNATEVSCSHLHNINQSTTINESDNC